MSVYTVRVTKDGRTLARKQVSEGLGRADAVVIKAASGVVYVLGEANGGLGSGAAPSKIKFKRAGKNLHISLGNGNPDVPDLVIEGYFDFPPAPIAGALENGALSYYDLGAVTGASATTTSQAAAAPAGAAEASSSVSATSNSIAESVLPNSGGFLGGYGWAAALGGLALAAGGGGGKGGDGAAPTTTDPATTAQNKITAYANDNTQNAPVLSDYTAIGVTGVTSGNLAAMNSAVDALAGTNVDSKTKLQTVVDAYVKILAEANGAAADATPGSNPSAADYATIGANVGLAATNAQALSLLNDILGNQTTAQVDTIAELNSLAAVVDKVMNVAAGGASTITLADLSLIGLPSSGAGAINSNNLAAVVAAIGAAGGQIKVDTWIELRDLANAAATIFNYAADNSNAVPTEAQYTTYGITGVTSSNLAAINSAVDALAGTNVYSKVKMQAVVDAYAFILAEANGATADATPGNNPTATQYAQIGSSIGLAATSTVNLSLLNDALGGLATTAVDTIAEINALATAANTVIAGAASTGAGGTAPTLAQLTLLGITGVTADNLAAVQNAIANTADSGLQVDTMSELQSVVTTAVNAHSASLTVFSNYAASSANAAPVLLDYTNLGVTGVSASNLAAMNTAVDALTSMGVNTGAKVQTLVNAYVKVLAEANGAAADATAADPTSDDYAAIGVSLGLANGGIDGGADIASHALSLLNDAVGALSVTAVDSVSRLNTLTSIVDKVLNLAKLTTGSSTAGATLTMADLTSLGVDTTLADLSTEQDAILQAIINTADAGSGVATILALQQIVNANAV